MRCLLTWVFLQLEKGVDRPLDKGSLQCQNEVLTTSHEHSIPFRLPQCRNETWFWSRTLSSHRRSSQKGIRASNDAQNSARRCLSGTYRDHCSSSPELVPHFQISDPSQVIPTTRSVVGVGAIIFLSQQQNRLAEPRLTCASEFHCTELFVDPNPQKPDKRAAIAFFQKPNKKKTLQFFLSANARKETYHHCRPNR